MTGVLRRRGEDTERQTEAGVGRRPHLAETVRQKQNQKHTLLRHDMVSRGVFEKTVWLCNPK